MKCLNKKLVLILIIFSNIIICKAQLLSVDKCFSGTNQENFSNTFKYSEDDSIRYFMISSNSHDNYFDSISNNIFSSELSGLWIVALNENTRESKRKFLGKSANDYYFARPVILGNEMVFTESTNWESPLFKSNLYAFKMDRDLNFTTPKILIDSFFPLSNSKLLGSFFTKGDTFINFYVYESRNYPHDQIHRYKLNSNGIFSTSVVSTLRLMNISDYNPRLVYNNKIFECYDSILKIYNADAEILATYQILNNSKTIKSITYLQLPDSSVLLKILSNDFWPDLNLVKINKNNSLEYNINISFSDKQYDEYSEDIIDSNLVVPLRDNDSLYYFRYDRNGNIINRFSEKYINYNGLKSYTLKYNDSVRIILKLKDNYRTSVQKINKNGVPLSTVSLSQTILYNNKILTKPGLAILFKTKKNRFYIVSQYFDLSNNLYSVLFEYNYSNNTIILQSVLNTNCNPCNQPEFKDIFSNDNNETFVITDVNDECVKGSDVVLYKLANGINTIQGKIYIDYNNNNTQDYGEPNYENGLLSYTKNNVTYSSYLIDTGMYTFLIDTGKYDVKFKPSDSIFTVSPNNRIINHTNYNNTDVINFILKPIGVVYDAKILMNNTFVTRPGFTGTYAITYTNNGNQSLNNFAIKLLLDNRLIPDSSNLPYTTNNDTLIWNLTNILQAGEHRTFYINFTAVTPPTLNSNDLLESTVSIIISQHDTNFVNNEFKFAELARGSYDPNEKNVNENNLSLTDVVNNKSLLYTIRFENIGTDTAFNITIKDTLPTNIDINSFKPIASSHPYTLSVTNKNILTFYFKNIRLPYKSINQEKAHGFVSYEIKPDKNIVLNDKIKNTAHIIFDYNLPISTNTTNTTIQVVSNTNNNMSLQDKIFIYPNPAKEQIEIQFKNIKLNNAIIKLIDISGNIILSENVTQEFLKLNVSKYASGTYIIIFENEHQIQSSKLIITR